MVRFTLSTWDWDDQALEFRILEAGERMVAQIRQELASLFGIASAMNYTPRARGCGGSRGSITLESAGRHDSAYAQARARFAASLGTGPALDGTLRNWDQARQRLCRWMNESRTVGLTTVSEGRTLISWKYFRTAGYYVNPFTYWLEQPAGSHRYCAALIGSPRALITMGPTALMFHEQDHEHDCVYGAGSRGHCNGEDANPYHSTELATVDDTDAALQGHPDYARRGNYFGGNDPRSMPGGRYPLQEAGEYVVWPSDRQLRTGVR